MSTLHATTSVSRRTALAGLGAGSLGLAAAVSARSAVAQDDMTTHPVVGLWQNAVTGPDSEKMPWTFSLYHADGTYHEWNGLDAGTALGIWRPTGDLTAEVMFIYQDTDPTTEAEVPGTATFRMAITADDTGNALTALGDLDVRTPDGILTLALSDFSWTSQRITFDWNPATGSTASGEGTPVAGTPTS